MKNEFKDFDDIHVPLNVKLDLYEKIEKQERKGIFMKRKLKTILIASAAIVLLVAIPLFQGNEVLDFSAYLHASETEVKEPFNEILSEKEVLDKALSNNHITIDEYFIKMEELKLKRDKLLEKQKELDKQYEVNETTIANSKQKEEVEAYLRELRELEALDEVLDAQEDELERQYRNGTISKAEFMEAKRLLEEKDDELDRKEDAIEHIVGDPDDDDFDDDDDDFDDDFYDDDDFDDYDD